MLPRSWYTQGAVSGLSAAIGYLLGTLAGAGLRWVLRRLGREPTPGARRRAWLALGVAGAVVVVAGLALWPGWQNQQRALVGMERLPATALAPMVALTLVLFVLLILVGRVVGHGVVLVDRLLTRRLPHVAAHGITAAVLVVAAVLLTRDVVVDGFLDWANRSFGAADTTTAPGVVAPATPTASGSPASLVAWSTLGEYGRGFVAGATTPAELRAFHAPGAEVKQPIRVYAGLRSAGSADERAALAVRELERTGAFSREILGVITTTGTGWVDPDAASSAEYPHAGDTALVGLQYSYLPSWISFLVDREEAAEAGVALYRHVHRRWSQLPATGRPRLIVFGESLGSFGAEAAFRGGDAAASLANLVAGSDGALFTGPTASNRIWDQLTDDREAGSPVWRPVYDGGATVQFANRPADLERPDPGWRHPRVLYVHHPSDPVGNATLEAFWRRPERTDRPQGYDVPARAGWYPVVTGLQEVFDLIAGFSAASAHGHNDDVDFVSGWAAVAPPAEWTAADSAASIATSRPSKERRCPSSSTTRSSASGTSGSRPPSWPSCSASPRRRPSGRSWSCRSTTTSRSTSPTTTALSIPSTTPSWSARTSSTRSSPASASGTCPTGPTRVAAGPGRSTPTTAAAASTGRTRAATSWRSSPAPTAAAEGCAWAAPEPTRERLPRPGLGDQLADLNRQPPPSAWAWTTPSGWSAADPPSCRHSTLPDPGSVPVSGRG
jgi:uncharacterized membrane protein